jgi:hypothetical protein
MAGSFSGKMAAPRDSLYAGEMQRIQNLYEIGPSVSPSHEAQVIVTDKGRWDQTLMRFEAWTFESHTIAFPLRVDVRWRKTFFTGRSKHAAAVNKQSVTIRFKIVCPSGNPERPLFEAQDAEGGLLSPVFRAHSVHDLEWHWLAQHQDIVQAREMVQGQKINGTGFIGFANINIVKFWMDQTPEFEHLRLERQETGRRGLGQVSGDRQLRRRAHNTMIEFDEVLSRG